MSARLKSTRTHRCRWIGRRLTTVVHTLSDSPRARNNSVSLKQFERTVSRHLRRNNGSNIVLHVNRIDGSLRAVRVAENREFAGKFLRLPSIPMKTDSDAHIVKNKSGFAVATAPLPTDLRSCKNTYSQIHIAAKVTQNLSVTNF